MKYQFIGEALQRHRSGELVWNVYASTGLNATQVTDSV